MGIFKRYAPYAEWLGRECWAVRPKKHKKARRYRVIAVSHKGAVCLRLWDDDSGHNGWWIGKEDVPNRVWWRWKDVPGGLR